MQNRFSSDSNSRAAVSTFKPPAGNPVGLAKPLAPSSTGANDPKRPSNGRVVLEQILRNPNLPSPPSIALQIVELTSDPNTDIRKLVRILQVDPAICAQLLRTVNSCLYALRTPATSIDRAITVIGFNPLRSLVLSMALPSLNARLDSDSGLRSYWRDSVAGGMIAREMAVKLRLPLHGEIFIAGLLRDLGMTLLRERFGPEYDPVWCVTHERSAELRGATQCDWERETLGLDHAELGATLLSRWNLPSELAEMVRHHHAPEATGGLAPIVRQGCKILDFSDRLARIESIAKNPESLREVFQLAEGFGMSVEELEQFLKAINPKVEEFAAILDIEIGSCGDLSRIVSSGRDELARLSELPPST